MLHLNPVTATVNVKNEKECPMSFAKLRSCMAAASLLLASPAIAQQSNWDTTFTFYLFAAETDTSISTPLGPIDSTLSFKDALENLDFAFMGSLEARNGPWTLIGDYAHTSLGFSNSTPGPAFSGLNADVKLQVANAYALYEAHRTPALSFDVGAGVRYFNADVQLDLVPGAAAGRTATFDDSWFDPVLAARLSFPISDKWSGRVFFDYGGFRSDSQSFQAVLTARYAFNDDWSLVIGYRYLDLKHGPANDELDFSQSGPLVGVSYKF